MVLQAWAKMTMRAISVTDITSRPGTYTYARPITYSAVSFFVPRTIYIFFVSSPRHVHSNKKKKKKNKRERERER
jgi:hypothetical protein